MTKNLNELKDELYKTDIRWSGIWQKCLST